MTCACGAKGCKRRRLVLPSTDDQQLHRDHRTPVAGTFTQPDPILDVTDPAQWNPYSYGAGNPVDRPGPTGLAYCTSTACGGGSTGSLGESGIITETPTRTRSSSRGGSRGGGGGSRYHGGGYNGGGHRAYRYTTPRTPPRSATTKARYKAPARPARVKPVPLVPPPPNPYLTCRACTFIWVIPIAVGITEAAIDTGITIGIGISIGTLADKLRKRLHTAVVHKNESEPRSVDDIVKDLSRGRGKKDDVRLVDSNEELEKIWDELTQGESEDARWKNYPGKSVKRSGGISVGLRDKSASGGRTVEIQKPGAKKRIKIHVR